MDEPVSESMVELLEFGDIVPIDKELAKHDDGKDKSMSERLSVDGYAAAVPAESSQKLHADKCTECNRSFGLFLWKYRCKFCGKTFCADCCSVSVRESSAIHIRACDACFKVSQLEGTQKTPSVVHTWSSGHLEASVPIDFSVVQPSSSRLPRLPRLDPSVPTSERWNQLVSLRLLPPDAELLWLTRQGIAPELRPRVWPMLARSHLQRNNHKDLYQKIVLRETLEQGSEQHISIDVDRTFSTSEHELPSKSTLSRLLRALSVYLSETGYHQAFSYLAVHCLSHLRSEEESFWLLVRVLSYWRLQELYVPHSDGLNLCVKHLDGLVEHYLPRLHQHFIDGRVNLEVVSGRWLLALFTYDFPRELAARLWDVFLLEGPVVIFRMALAVLTQAQDKLLAMEPSLILPFLSRLPPNLFPGVDEAITMALDRYADVKPPTLWLTSVPQELSSAALAVRNATEPMQTFTDSLNKEVVAISSSFRNSFRRLWKPNYVKQPSIQQVDQDERGVASLLTGPSESSLSAEH